MSGVVSVFFYRSETFALGGHVDRQLECVMSVWLCPFKCGCVWQVNERERETEGVREGVGERRSEEERERERERWR